MSNIKDTHVAYTVVVVTAEDQVRATGTFHADDAHEYEMAQEPLGRGGQGAVYRGQRSDGTEWSWWDGRARR